MIQQSVAIATREALTQCRAANEEQAAELADLLRQRDALLAALRLAERNTAARIYMLPRTARVLDSQALETELATYRAAIAACQPKEI